MTETTRAKKGNTRMRDSQGSMAQEKDSEHQRDTLAGTEGKHHKQGLSTEKETTVMKEEEKTLRRAETEHMRETTGKITEDKMKIITEETDQETPKTDRITEVMKEETGIHMAADLRETEVTHGTEMALNKEIEKKTKTIPDNQRGKDTEKIQEQEKTQDSETTPGQETDSDQRPE